MAFTREALLSWIRKDKEHTISHPRSSISSPVEQLRTKIGREYSVIFDAEWYRGNFLESTDHTLWDAARLLDHYVRENAAGLRNPSVFFDLAWYRNVYHADCPQLSGIELLNNFFDQVGLTERSPSPFFAPDWYYDRYEAVRERIAAGVTTSILEDYLLFGGQAGLRPNAWFDEMWYRKEHPEIIDELDAKRIVSAYHHYLMFGQFKGFDPDPRFSSRRYLSLHPDVAAAVATGHMASAFDHFIRYGEREGRGRGNDVVNGATLNAAL